MVCPKCNGRGETIYYVEISRDENTIIFDQRKEICQTCNGSGKKPMTNDNDIQNMNNRELVKFICNESL